MHNAPLVSVYLPTRNRPVLLERAVRSVFAQTHRNIQLVIADDGSTPETGETLERLARVSGLAAPVTILRLKSSAGACQARNLALEACEGRYATGLDDDDYFLPDRIARLLAAFDPDACSFAFDGYIRETVQRSGLTRRKCIPLRQPAALPALLRRNIVGNQVFTLTARLRAVGGYDPQLPAWQDYDLWIRLVRAFGAGRSAGGCSYVHLVDHAVPRISTDTGKIERAFDIFLQKHPDYADKQLLLCLRLAKAVYGLSGVGFSDLPDLIRLGEPRYVLFAAYSYMARRRAGMSSR